MRHAAICLDALATAPDLAAAIGRDDRRVLVLRCLTVLAALAAVPEPEPVAPDAPPLSAREVARRLGMSRSWVYGAFKRGELPPPISIEGRPRWRAQDIETYLANRRQYGAHR